MTTSASASGPVPTDRQHVLAGLRVEPGRPADLALRGTTWEPPADVDQARAAELAGSARAVLAKAIDELSDAQELLWASDRRALLVVFQAMDAAGKDSTIEHVMTGVNPQGVQVTSFKKPSNEELDHTFLWRIAKAAPERGRIGIFNRSHYEEVVALRVHPDRIDRAQLPGDPSDPTFWADRHDDINAFERHLARNGTTVVKFFLQVSRDEQKRRFLARLDNPDKQWKFNAADLVERARWADYMAAYETAITATSTPWAPWYVLPADDKSVLQALAATVLVDTITSLGLDWPKVSANDRETNARARRALLEEE